MHGANRLGGNGVANSTVFGGIAGDTMPRWIRANAGHRPPDESALEAVGSIRTTTGNTAGTETAGSGRRPANATSFGLMSVAVRARADGFSPMTFSNVMVRSAATPLASSILAVSSLPEIVGTTVVWPYPGTELADRRRTEVRNVHRCLLMNSLPWHADSTMHAAFQEPGQ